MTMMEVLDSVRRVVRRLLHPVAKFLNSASRGKLTPNTVTAIGLLAHVFIAWLIVTSHLFLGGLLLIVFGLTDALDGQLARLQDRETSFGMLFDATSDRFKEVLLYSAIAYYFVSIQNPFAAVWAVAACGASLCVSYIKAKGEVAMSAGAKDIQTINHMFEDGLMRFEVRMFVLIVGLIFSALLPIAVAAIAILSSLTAIDRLIRIREKLRT